MRFGRITPVLAVVCLLATASPGRAEIITINAVVIGGEGTFSGSFSNDNDIALIEFEVLVASMFSANTISFADFGGFDPLLTLFDSAGTLLAENDDAELGVQFDSALLTMLLQPGLYTLALTQTLNYASAGGFTFDNFEIDGVVFDNSRYTVDLLGGDPGCVGGFANVSLDAEGNTVGSPCLSSSFEGIFTLTPEQTASVPEPGTLILVALGLGVAGLKRRRTG
jgi:hypothetical protein